MSYSYRKSLKEKYKDWHADCRDTWAQLSEVDKMHILIVFPVAMFYLASTSIVSQFLGALPTNWATLSLRIMHGLEMVTTLYMGYFLGRSRHKSKGDRI